jgi:hypothetical protein
MRPGSRLAALAPLRHSRWPRALVEPPAEFEHLRGGPVLDAPSIAVEAASSGDG